MQKLKIVQQKDEEVTLSCGRISALEGKGEGI